MNVNPASIDCLHFAIRICSQDIFARPPIAVYTQGYTCRYMVWQAALNRATVIGQSEAMSPPEHALARSDWPQGAGLAARGSLVTLRWTDPESISKYTRT